MSLERLTPEAPILQSRELIEISGKQSRDDLIRLLIDERINFTNHALRLILSGEFSASGEQKVDMVTASVQDLVTNKNGSHITLFELLENGGDNGMHTLPVDTPIHYLFKTGIHLSPGRDIIFPNSIGISDQYGDFRMFVVRRSESGLWSLSTRGVDTILDDDLAAFQLTQAN